MLDDESHCTIKGAIEASGGTWIDMIINGVLWRPGQIMYDPIFDRE